MFRFFGGKPRGGKTKAAVIEIIDALRFSSMPIVTNIALQFQPWVDGAGVPRRGLLRVLQDTYHDTFDAERRIYLLKEEEVRRFYGIRPIIPRDGSERTIEIVPKTVSEKWVFDANRYPGCFYLIDEAHVYYPGASVAAAKGIRLSTEELGYASQAGRCGDLVVMISQELINVDKRLRGVSQECWYFTNHVHCNVGPFRQPDKIGYRVFSATPPAPGETWLKKGTLRYNRNDVESCYNTSAGVGVSGNSAADIGRHARGLPYWLIWALIGGCAFGFLGFAVGIREGVARFMKLGGGQQAGAVTNAPAVFSANQLATLSRMIGQSRPAQVVSTAAPPVSVSVPAAAPLDSPSVVGLCRGSASCSVMWSDGSVTSHDEVVERGRVVVVDGVEYRRGVVLPKS